MSGIFVAWRRLSRRTEDLSRELGLELIFIRDRPPYAKAFAKTLEILRKKKPRVVFVQLPQGPLLAEVVTLSKLLKFRIAADVHTGFIYTTTFKETLLNKPFHRYLRSADLVLAHNTLEKELIVEKAGVTEERVVVVYDPLPTPPQRLSKPEIDIDFSRAIVLPVSWAPDEPIDRAVEEFLKSRASKEYTLIVTGNYERDPRLYNKVVEAIKKFEARDNVILTGFIQDEQYWYLLKNSKAVIALTRREYTIPHAMWEAVSLQKPFATVKTRALELELGSGYPCMFSQDLTDFAQVLNSCVVEERLGEVMNVVKNLAVKSRQCIEKLKEVIQNLTQLKPKAVS
jgi:glycosyltransferase involved in cell wall biosynthesis